MKALWLCLCVGLAACTETGVKTWYRADGSAHSPGQLESDKVVCEQEMRKPRATNVSGLDRDVVQADLYEKCMTRLGYTDSKMRASVPSGAAPVGAPPAGAVAGAPAGAVASAPAGAPQGAASAAAAPPAAPSGDCRKVTDLRMWLPLCP
jgi:hypothetical protein